MTKNLRNRWLRFTAVTLLLFVTLSLFTSSAKAQEFVYGSVVPVGETVENDVLLNGTDLRVNGTVNGDVFAFGQTVTINGDISGSLFAVAEEVVINGAVNGSVYVISLSLHLNEAANINHSVYYVGVSLQTARDSQIGRDLNGLSLSAILQGSVGRNTNLIIGLFEIGRIVFDWFTQLNTGKETAMTLLIDEQAAIPVRIIPASIATGGALTFLSPTAQIDADTAVGINNWLNRFLQGLVSFLIVGGLAIWLTPRPFTSWTNEVQARPLPAFGWGLVAYIMGFVATLILALVVIAIGAFLLYISLWPLALTWLGIGLSGLGFAFWTFILFVGFLSKAIVAYVIGFWIFGKLYAKGNGRLLWPLLLGLLIYTLICMIPILGWAWGFVVTCIGLGAVWQVIREHRRQSGDGDVVIVEDTVQA